MVLTESIDHNGNHVGVRVIGRSERRGKGQCAMILERPHPATTMSATSWFDWQPGWRCETFGMSGPAASRPFIRLTGDVDFSLNGSNIAVPRRVEPPSVVVDALHGRASFVGVLFSGHPDNLPAVVGSASDLLLLGCQGDGEFLADRGGGRIVRLHNLIYAPGGGFRPIADRGQADPSFIRTMLEMVRQPPPAPTGAARLTRVMLSACRIGVRVSA